MSIDSEPLLSLIRDAALSQTKVFTGHEDFEINTHPEGVEIGDVLAHRQVLINLSGSEIRLLIKLHFNENIDELVKSRVSSSDEEEFNVEQRIEFIKEMLSLVCSHMASALENSGLDLGMSVPLSTRGYYEIHSKYEEVTSPTLKFCDLFSLECPKYKLFFTVQADVSNAEILADKDFKNDSDSSPKIDFL